jgi:ppGpp synthetase/RelA/SpoT-type nucleotidyltranferase
LQKISILWYTGKNKKFKELVRMPRGRKVVIVKSIDEQLIDIDTQIEEYKQKIADAKDKRKMLLDRKEKEEMAALYEAVKARGKTPGELLKSLQEV